MAQETLHHYFAHHSTLSFIITPQQTFSYSEVLQMGQNHPFVKSAHPHTVTPFPAPLSPETIAILFGLLDKESVPLPYHPKTPQVPLTDLSQHIPSEIQLFTSGTTSTPKRVIQSIDRLFANAIGANRHIPFSAGDRWHLELPLNHVGGLSILFRALLEGGTVQIGFPINQATHASLVPTQLYRYLQHKTDLTTLKVLLLGGAPASSSLLDKAIQQNIPFYLTYGMTEMGSQITTAQKFEQNHAGKPLQGREILIDTSGQILVKGKSLFYGYVAQTPLQPDQWFPTKDIGIIDPQGNLVISGRKDRMFICGGENIHPEEIEKSLNSYSSIIRSRIEPIADDEYGNRPIAYIESTSPINPVNLSAYLRQHLTPNKIPTQYHPMPTHLIPLK